METAYEVILLDKIEADTLQRRIDRLLAAETIMRERRGKAYDLRPLILALSFEEEGEEEEGLRLQMRLMLRPGKTGRPDELLDALGIDPLGVRAHRTAIVLEDEARVPERRTGHG